jgi:hypothetical protein
MAGSWEPLEPPVWKWYRVYAGVMGGLYLLITIGGVALAVFAPNIDGEQMGLFMGAMYAIISLPFTAAYIAAFFIPRAPWAWVYHLVLICIGLSSVCCLPVTIPLLIQWLKPVTKQFFGRPA